VSWRVQLVLVLVLVLVLEPWDLDSEYEDAYEYAR